MRHIAKCLRKAIIFSWPALGVLTTSAWAATVVEFYNTNLDHYFITADSSEAAAIDNGSAGPGWSRTGSSFTSGGSTPVCRFYGSQSPGPNSHFYTVDAAECGGLKQLQASTPATQKRWNFESLDFYSTPPSNGTCPGGTVPVYRAYNDGFARGVDSNHRITSSLTAIQEVVNRGWNSEGVVMCAPSTAAPGSMKWMIGNQCSTETEVDYKFYDSANNWLWPSSSTYYFINYNQTLTNSLSCMPGNKVCIGGKSGSWSWGVGIAGTLSCTNCCYTCDGGTHAYTFGCTSSPPPSGGTAYQYWKGDLPNSYDLLNIEGRPARTITGKPFLVLTYDTITLEILDLEFGLSEVTQVAKSNVYPVSPEPTLDASTIDFHEKLGLKSPVDLIVSWNVYLPNSGDKSTIINGFQNFSFRSGYYLGYGGGYSEYWSFSYNLAASNMKCNTCHEVMCCDGNKLQTLEL